ncbi:MAG: OmpA family protein [Bacteroidota bacterium]
MMNYKHCFLAILLCLLVQPAFTQDSAKKLKSEGFKYFENEKYHEALNLLLKYQRLKQNDLGARFRIGICYYFTNDVAQSKRYLSYVIENDRKVNPQAYYYMGRNLHAENKFKAAIKFYKLYLRNTKSSNKDRRSVKDAIRRCATGLKVAGQPELAIVENLGEKVNDIGDDFAPLLSPNFDNKLYFSSSRRGNLGGLRNKEGLRDDKYGNYNTDIFSTVVINGEWTATTPLNSLLNSPRHDVVLDFNEAGSVMFFLKSGNLYSGEIYVDTFKSEGDEIPLYPPRFVSPMISEDGDGTPFLFGDTLLIFSSDRKGGYGGRDLYISTYRNGLWMAAQNLGPTINSAYDEKTPFLSKDGRTLYFSSNSRASLGGFDVFKSRFDDGTRQWNTPMNLGLPINSSADDAYFRLSKNGQRAYYSSSRKEGYGRRDLYVAYFKAAQNEQLYTSMPSVFTDLLNLPQQGVAVNPEQIPPATTLPPPPVYTADQIEKVSFQPLYYREDDRILTSANINQLNKVAKLLKRYPPLRVVLSCNSSYYEGPRQFDLYFSIKRAEKAAEYLMDNGVLPNKIHIKGVGNNYPLAKAETEQGPNPLAKKYNRRIDMDITNTAGLPVEVTAKMPNVGGFTDDRGIFYRKAVMGLSYQVQIASLKQMYNSDLFISYSDPTVERTMDNDTYRYLVGLYKTFSSADQLKGELQRRGLSDAFVVPYLDGRRLSRLEAQQLINEYPDLSDFLLRTAQ